MSVNFQAAHVGQALQRAHQPRPQKFIFEAVPLAQQTSERPQPLLAAKTQAQEAPHVADATAPPPYQAYTPTEPQTTFCHEPKLIIERKATPAKSKPSIAS